MDPEHAIRAGATGSPANTQDEGGTLQRVVAN
jgi:hypothetical protein